MTRRPGGGWGGWSGRRRALVSAGVLALGAAAVGVDVEAGGLLAQLDPRVLRAAVRVRSPGLTRVVVVVTDAGSWPSRTALGAVVATGLSRATRSRRPLVVTAVALALAPATSAVVKRLVGRERPPRALAVTTPDDPSFPSGHATSTAALAVVLAGLALRAADARVGRAARVLVVVAAAAGAGAVGSSRVYLGAHWLSDVLAGEALGAAVGLVVLELLGRPPGPGVKAS